MQNTHHIYMIQFRGRLKKLSQMTSSKRQCLIERHKLHKTTLFKETTGYLDNGCVQ